MSRILYKYLDITGAKCMIGNRKLQFTNATQLNDPFDCHPKLLDYSNVPMHGRQDSFLEEFWEMKYENDAIYFTFPRLSNCRDSVTTIVLVSFCGSSSSQRRSST